MKYKLVERGNPLDKTAPKKTYAQPVYDGRVDLKVIANDLVLISALSRGDISSVLENTVDIIPKYLLMGKSVQLGELGTLRLSFSSEGVDDTSTFTVGMIRGRKVLFTAGSLLKGVLHNLTFEREKEKK